MSREVTWTSPEGLTHEMRTRGSLYTSCDTAVIRGWVSIVDEGRVVTCLRCIVGDNTLQRMHDMIRLIERRGVTIDPSVFSWGQFHGV